MKEIYFLSEFNKNWNLVNIWYTTRLFKFTPFRSINKRFFAGWVTEKGEESPIPPLHYLNMETRYLFFSFFLSLHKVNNWITFVDFPRLKVKRGGKLLSYITGYWKNLIYNSIFQKNKLSERKVCVCPR